MKQEKNKAAIALGKLGGSVTAKRGSEYFKKINAIGKKVRIKAIKRKACERSRLQEVPEDGGSVL